MNDSLRAHQDAFGSPDIDFLQRTPLLGPSLIDDLPDHEPNVKSGADRQPMVALSGHWTPL
jgi:hypothetical protein